MMKKSFTLALLAACSFVMSQDIALTDTPAQAVGATVIFPLKQKGAFTFDSQMEAGSELTFRFRLAEKGSVTLRASGARFSWSAAGDDAIRTQFFPNEKVNVRKDVTIFTRGVVNKSLSWDESLSAWSRFRRYNVPKLTDLDLSARIVSDGDSMYVYLNGYFAGKIPRGRVSLTFDNADMLSATESVNPDVTKYTTIDLSAKYNMPVSFKRGAYPENLIRIADGVPFFFAQGSKRGNLVDLSPSWSPFAAIRSEGDEFGGRWGGIWQHNSASQNTPWNFRFRVPKGDYKALHVLAVTDKPIPEAIDFFTVQFYRPGAGYPKAFVSPSVPSIKASEVKGDAKRIEIDGRAMYLVTVPLDSGILKEFADLDYAEFELTKEVLDYQCYPDPFFYSRHGGGLPSGVKIYAATLEKADVSFDFQPSKTANVFAVPEDEVKYSVTLENTSSSEKKLELVINTVSWDGSEKTSTAKKKITLAPNEKKSVDFILDDMKKFGHHDIELSVTGDETYNQKRSLARLRSRENTNPDFDFPGFMFGFWNWRGGHYTLNGAPLYEAMGKAGFKGTSFGMPDPGYNSKNADFLMANKYNFRTYFAGDLWPTDDYEKKIAEGKKRADDEWKKYLERNNLRADTARPENPLMHNKYFAFGTEPSFGIWTQGSLPQYYGEDELDPLSDDNKPVLGVKLNADHGSAYKRMIDGLKKSIPLVKADNPGIKIMVPWGDPNFAIPFMRDPALAELIDGVLYDSGQFDRMPETQLHQTVIHRMWQFRNEWFKYTKKEPLISTIEGPCYSGVLPGALTEDELAAYSMRSMLLMGAYGANRQFSAMGGSVPSDYWGEQHYGGGTIGRFATLNPHVAFSAIATLTRHMENTRFIRPVTIESAPSIYAVEHETLGKNPEKVYFIWTLRGTRGMKLDGKRVKVFDAMDNEVKAKDGDFTISSLPLVVYGISDLEKQAAFGTPDHSDSVNSEHTSKIASMGDGTWKQIQEEDKDYTEVAANFIRRFPAEMTLEVTGTGDASQLAVTLPKQEKNRGTMPHYTTLVPSKAITIPGGAESLNFDVEGVGDWGRILLVLRDAKGEKWISCGVKNEWNCDDTKSLSVLNFEGNRLVKIPLPGNAPYDSFRLSGTASYAAYNGDERVDYPLSLEKVILERREQFIHVNSMTSLEPKAVKLGNIYAEYDSKDKMTKDYEKIANMRMPMPRGNVSEPNPITVFASDEKAPAATAILKMEEPVTYNDGTNGILHFTPVEDAESYDIYVSAYPTGEGALKLAGNVKTSPIHIRGFRADKDFYAFVVYRNKDKKMSKPSAPFKFNMKKNFGNL